MSTIIKLVFWYMYVEMVIKTIVKKKKRKGKEKIFLLNFSPFLRRCTHTKVRKTKKSIHPVTVEAAPHAAASVSLLVGA